MDKADLPDTWNIHTGENIRWKTGIPGLAHSCPVVWGDRLFLTTAVSASGKDSLKVGLYGDIDEVGDRSVHEFRVYCIDKYTGEVLWEKLAHKMIPRTERYTKSSHANPSPATNGKFVVAFFGSEGMFCYDFDTGQQIWNLGGGGDAPAPTPIFAHDLIFIHGSHGRYSPIFAIKPEARGDITLHPDSTKNQYIAWSIKRGAAYLPTNLVYGEFLYNLRMNGNLTCYMAITGEVVYRERIPDAMGISASGVCSDGKLYYSL